VREHGFGEGRAAGDPAEQRRLSAAPRSRTRGLGQQFGPADIYTAYVSYAYPAGMGTKLINKVEIPVVK
jgi:hypothetical protein